MANHFLFNSYSCLIDFLFISYWFPIQFLFISFASSHFKWGWLRSFRSNQGTHQHVTPHHVGLALEPSVQVEGCQNGATLSEFCTKVFHKTILQTQSCLSSLWWIYLNCLYHSYYLHAIIYIYIYTIWCIYVCFHMSTYIRVNYIMTFHDSGWSLASFKTFRTEL